MGVSKRRRDRQRYHRERNRKKQPAQEWKKLELELSRALRCAPDLRSHVQQILDDSRPEWTPWVEVTGKVSSPLARRLGNTDGSRNALLYLAYGGEWKDVRFYQNARYLVQVGRFDVPVVGRDGGKETMECVRLSIRDMDNSARHDWRDLQRIKNELVGPDYEACELYPAEDRLVDTANQFYLWVIPRGERFPFGFRERLVLERSNLPGHSQRRFEPSLRPVDLQQPDDLQAELDRLLQARHELAKEEDNVSTGTCSEGCGRGGSRPVEEDRPCRGCRNGEGQVGGTEGCSAPEDEVAAP
jgi:hypothetical protein